MTYRVTTQINDAIITQAVTQQHEDFVKTISRSILDTQEAQTHKALVKLGWTPPTQVQVRFTQHELDTLRHVYFKLATEVRPHELTEIQPILDTYNAVVVKVSKLIQGE